MARVEISGRRQGQEVWARWIDGHVQGDTEFLSLAGLDPFNWFNGQDPERGVGNYLVDQLGGHATYVDVSDCRPAQESPTAEPSALFDCAIEAEEPVELELEGGGFVRLDEGHVSLCFTIPSARQPRSFLAPEPARLDRVGRCLA